MARAENRRRDSLCRFDFDRVTTQLRKRVSTAEVNIMMITIKAFDGGEFAAYLARPASGKGPGIVLIQEIFGVNDVMRDIADRYSELGFVVLCPDLFWRQQPGIELTDQTDAEWARAFELYKGLDEAKAVDDAAATMNALREHA